VPAFRKQGLFTSLVAVRAQEARRRGARFLTVDARPMSRPILEALGFKLLCFANALNWRM
jgi:GNAT superfamily N-acetyltransferase